MKKLILILILFGCQKTIQPTNLISTHPEEWSSTIVWDQGNPLIYRGITIGNDTASTPGWDMEQTEKGAIADKRHSNASIELTAWCKRIDINTFISPNHGGYKVVVDGDTTVISLDGEPRRIETTFSVKNLEPANHKISIIPEPDKTFIFYSMVKYVDFAPVADGDSTIYTIPPIDPIECPECIPDTIYKVRIDTIFLPSGDSIIYMEPQIWLKADELIWQLK